MNILLFGAPGSGKGTQSALLLKKFPMQHVSTGDLFREAVRSSSPLGVEAKQYLDAGQLVPDSITIGLINEVFQKRSGKDFILDGFPRTVPQAEALEKLLAQNKMTLGKVFFLEVPDQILLGRLTGRRVCQSCGAVYHVDSSPSRVAGVCDKCGGSVVQRQDDKEEVIAQRLVAYSEKTAPLKAFYKAKGTFVAVDGTGTAEEVLKRIESSL